MIGLEAVWKKHLLKFNFEAKTSRDTLRERPVWFIIVKKNGKPLAIGECAWLKGLSIESEQDIEPMLSAICKDFGSYFSNPELLRKWPSIQMALDMIRAQIESGQWLNPFPGKFAEGKQEIPINGLVWMGSKDAMLQSLEAKIAEGFKCVKLKIGGIDFQEELRLLEFVRNQYNENEIEIRLDANGAFAFNEAIHKLKSLAKFKIHSIEQPIKQGHWEKMAEIVAESPIPIALDEELIGMDELEQKAALLELIKPRYIILKPSLIGGFSASQEWIDAAEKQGIQWWLTSMLESNIGLNALAQWVSTKDTFNLPQGLGTGKLYSNNVDCGLEIAYGFIRYNPNTPWNLRNIEE
jgi:o-succinylbenzoate synthase